MKKLVTLIVFLFVSIASAQNNDAKALLNKVTQKVNSYDNVSIDFKYVLQNLAENVNQETRGDVVIQGDKYKLNILGITRIFDGSKLYSISPADEEVTISNENEDVNITPCSF